MEQNNQEQDNRVGLGIGIISRGTVPIKWMMHMDHLKKYMPAGLSWKYIVVEGKQWADARTEVVHKAKKLGFEWLLFCFKGDEEVETDYGPKRINSINVGDKVKTHKNRFREVKKVYKTPYKQRKEIKKIHTPFSDIECTPEHPFLVNGKRWVEAKNINEGDELLYPYQNHTDELKFNIKTREKNQSGFGSIGKYFNNKIGTLEVDEDLAKFLGFYLAEGSASHDGIRFTFNNNETEYIDFITRICREKFKREPTIYSRWATTVKLNIVGLSQLFIDWFGKYAKEKRIPSFVFNWNLKNKISFLKAYIDGDGCWKKDVIQISTASYFMSNDLVKLLMDVGIGYSKTYKYGPQKPNKKISGRYIYSSGSYIISISKKRKNKLLDIYYAKTEKNYLVVPVMSIEDKNMPRMKDQFVYNLEVEEDNSYIVGPVIAHNCDDDVFLPADAINRLMSSGKKIITGVYWTKTNPPRPVIFKKFGDAPYDNFPVDETIEIAGAGLGCTLIHMSVFDEFDKHNMPYFLENWVYKDQFNNNQKCPVGEDHYFFIKARELGYNVWCDTGVLCDHFDSKTQQFFPGDSVVEKISAEQLKKHGKEDIVEEQNKKKGKDPNKRTVAFLSPTSVPFDGDELAKRPVGGAETATIYLSKHLAHQGVNVHVFCQCNEPGVYDGVMFSDLRNMTVDKLKELDIDLLVVSRNPTVLENFNPEDVAKKTVLWAHDMAEDPVWDGVPDQLHKLDQVLVLSEWHKKDVMGKRQIPEEKLVVTTNGVNTKLFQPETKNKGMCVYSSMPFRGLDVLLEVWPEIKQRAPHAELFIFSSMKTYGSTFDDSQFHHLYEHAKNLPGVHYYGGVKQETLAQYMNKAELMLYPSTFSETNCISVLEAQSSGAYVIASNKAALAESVKKGKLIDGEPKSQEYKQKFIEETVNLLNSDKNYSVPEDFSWEMVALHWVKDILPRTGNEKEESAEEVNSAEYWNNMYRKEIEEGKVGNTRGNNDRFDYINKFINEGDKVIDVGCGTGEFTRYLREKSNNEIWGCDISNVALDYCRNQDRTIFYANHPIENPEEFQGHFDIVSAQHLVEHYKNPAEIMVTLRQLVKDGGKLIIVIPLNDEPWPEHPKIWREDDIVEFIENWTEEGDKPFFKVHKLEGKQYKDGRNFEEAIIVIKVDKNEEQARMGD